MGGERSNVHSERHQMPNLMHGRFHAQTLPRSPSPSFGREKRSFGEGVHERRREAAGPGRYDPHDPYKKGHECYNWGGPKFSFGKEKRKDIESTNGYGGKIKPSRVGPGQYDLFYNLSVSDHGPTKTKNPQYKFGTAERRHHSCTANNNPWVSTNPRTAGRTNRTGPGHYNHLDLGFEKTQKTAPSFGFGPPPRTPRRARSETPGPGRYM